MRDWVNKALSENRTDTVHHFLANLADQMVKRLIDLKILRAVPGRVRNRQFEAKMILDILKANK